jgi:hypothetical protein
MTNVLNELQHTFMIYFFADMSTTQKSKRMNAMLKLWLDNHTSIYNFVIKIESMVHEIWDRENDEDMKTLNETSRLWSKYQIERDTREVYMRTYFSLFKELLNESTFGVVIEI